MEKLESWFYNLIEKTPVWALLSIFWVIVIICTFFYWGLTSFTNIHGISSGINNTEIGFWNCLYFSIITISSLGYGDFLPLGISKVIACLEVISGLVLIGTLIAKITSSRLAFQVHRIYVNDVRRKFEEFNNNFLKIKTDLNTNYNIFLRFFGETPIREIPYPREKPVEKFRMIMTNFTEILNLFNGYLSHEAKEENFHKDAPSDLLLNCGKNLEDILFNLRAFISSLNSKQKFSLLTNENRNITHLAMQTSQTISKVIIEKKNLFNEKELANCFSRLDEICKGFTESYFNNELNKPGQLTDHKEKSDSEGETK